jgi:uncharacterized LabA/DUF88 family protein
MSVMQADDKLIRIGVVYDGNFFLHVSNYYLYHHGRGARISLDGLHAFVRSKVAELEGTEARYCPIIDAHYFRGRLPSKVVEERNRLLSERVFEDILIRQNITTHYLPIPEGRAEKGIDVWLALETYELAVLKRFNVIVLIAGDGDFVPLVRKLNSLGTRVMLLGWDFRYQDENGDERETRTSQALQAECTYPLMMSSVIVAAAEGDARVNNLFVPAGLNPRPVDDPRRHEGRVDEFCGFRVRKDLLLHGFARAAPVGGKVIEDRFACRSGQFFGTIRDDPLDKIGIAQSRMSGHGLSWLLDEREDETRR